MISEGTRDTLLRYKFSTIYAERNSRAFYISDRNDDINKRSPTGQETNGKMMTQAADYKYRSQFTDNFLVQRWRTLLCHEGVFLCTYTLNISHMLTSSCTSTGSGFVVLRSCFMLSYPN